MAGSNSQSKRDKRMQAKRAEVQRRLRESYEDFQRSQHRPSESSPPGDMLGGSSPIGEGSLPSESSSTRQGRVGSSSREEGLPDPELISSEVMSSESSHPSDMLGRSSPEGEGQQPSESSSTRPRREESPSSEGGQPPSSRKRKKRRKKGQPSESSSPSDMLAGIPNTGQPHVNNPWQGASSSSSDTLEESVPPRQSERSVEEWIDYFRSEGYRSSSDRLGGSSRNNKRSAPPAQLRQVQNEGLSESSSPSETRGEPSRMRGSSASPARKRPVVRAGLRTIHGRAQALPPARCWGNHKCHLLYRAGQSRSG